MVIEGGREGEREGGRKEKRHNCDIRRSGHVPRLLQTWTDWNASNQLMRPPPPPPPGQKIIPQ